MNLQEQLSEIILNLGSLKVESTLILGAIFLLIAGLIKKANWLLKSIYAATLLLAIYFNWQGFTMGEILSESISLTRTAHNFTFVLLLSCLLILLYRRSSEHATEFYFFILSLLIGSTFLMKANSFLVTFLSIELTSFSAYILTNFSFKKNGFEAGIKYLLFGAISTAIMLFGFGMIYGSTGTFFISDWETTNTGTLQFGIGLVFIIFGLLFKASIVPFHIWVPATYQSAPNDATAVLSIAPKLAAFVLLHRIYLMTSIDGWIIQLCLVLGILTIVFGTFSALKQTNARRMISFGAIAHSGFLLPLALLSSETAEQAFWWYAVVYAVMNVAVFYFLDEYEKNSVITLDDYNGLGNRNLIANVSIAIVLISLIGLPPLAGFTAKFFMFGSLLEFYSQSEEILYLVYLAVAVFATLISLFFYLRIPYRMFLVKTETPRSIEFSLSTKIIATLFSIVLLLLFFVPQILTVMQQLLTSHIAHE
ncbi:MAG: NADH-quinone oxidoreductase subunit N [Cyclobacteriaceae bacterium]